MHQVYGAANATARGSGLFGFGRTAATQGRWFEAEAAWRVPVALLFRRGLFVPLIPASSVRLRILNRLESNGY